MNKRNTLLLPGIGDESGVVVPAPDKNVQSGVGVPVPGLGD